MYDYDGAGAWSSLLLLLLFLYQAILLYIVMFSLIVNVKIFK